MSIEFYHDPQGDPKSLIVVNSVGVMRRIYTPFRVICIEATPGISIDTQVYVDAVMCSIGGEIYFIIFKQPHPHKHFRLLIKF